MSEEKPSMEEWKKLYEWMDKIKEAAPWEEMAEQDVFAVEDPDTGEIGMVSVMGANGEHYSIALYRGEEGITRFWDFQNNFNGDSDEAFQRLMENPHMQATFEDWEYLANEDRNIIGKLGLTYKGAASWPMFRSYKPGFMPWFLGSSEARFLTHVLEQTLVMFARFQEDEDILVPDDGSLLLRQPSKNGSQIEWRDSAWRQSGKGEKTIEFYMDEFAFEKLRRITERKGSYEVDIFMTPHGIHEKGQKPYYPYILMFLNKATGRIDAFQLVPPLPDLATMWRKMPSIIAGKLSRIKFIPEKMAVSSENLYQSLMFISEQLNVSIEYVDKLVMAPKAKQSFIHFTNRSNDL